MSLSAGIAFDGRYVLQQPLGSGAFGHVWLAQDLRFSLRPVVLKILRAELTTDPEAVARFTDEAVVLSALRHENVVTVFDRGLCNGWHYLVLEYVPGQALQTWLDAQRKTREPPPIALVRALFRELCSGVAAAHRVQPSGPVVHRDLKPSNVLLAPREHGSPRVVVVDFGLARLLARQRKHTATGAQLGTLEYMAPEQGLGQWDQLDARTDVFALGLLLLEMLTLAPTLRALGDGALWGHVLEHPERVRAALYTSRVGVPSGVWEVLARCFERSLDKRPDDAQALLELVEKAWETSPARSSSRRVLFALAAAVPVSLGVGLLLSRLFADPGPPPTPISWTDNAVRFRSVQGTVQALSCPANGAATSTVWGTDVYTDDSSICTAAVHAGKLTAPEGGAVRIRIHGSRGPYAGSTRNGVTTGSWTSYPGSFTFE